MSAAKYDITIDQGSDFSVAITLSENGGTRDLSAYSARASMRTDLDSNVATDFVINMNNSSDGIINISLPHSVSRDMSSGYYVYDLEIFQGTAPNETAVSRILEGRVTIKREVTRHGY